MEVYENLQGDEIRQEEGVIGIVVQSYADELENWEVQDAEPLRTQPQLTLHGKEKERSLWVQQNMIKLGKILGADFKGHKEEALELLFQVDSSKAARRMETAAICRKNRIKGA